MASVSACIPCFNHWKTVPDAIESIRQQSVPVEEILVVDDGSTTPFPYPNLTEAGNIRLHRNEENRGRGYSRAVSTQMLSSEFILTLDATNTLESGFVEKALPHFEDPTVAAVSGTLTSDDLDSLTNRWRARHLFRENSLADSPEPCSMLITYGTLLRRSAIEKAGGFNPDLRYKEDQDMGERLAEAGYVVIGDPAIKIFPNVTNTLPQLLERYARWYMDPEDKPSLRGYLHNIRASFRPMMQTDLREGDPAAALISFLAPHFQLYHSIKARISKSPASNRPKTSSRIK